MRYYYYAVALPGGQWQLRSSLDTGPTVHPGRERALVHARQLCRRRWESEGIPCGVRVQHADGAWLDDVIFGTDAEEDKV